MDAIAQVRGFNRLVTLQVGAVNERYLGRRPLGECRVLFEIGGEGATPRELRSRLGLDSGHLARLLRGLEAEKLVETTPDPQDRRTKRLELTAKGRRELAALDRISDELAAATLAPLSDEQRTRLLDAQREVRQLLALSMIAIDVEDPASADARWCLARFFAELHERFGLDPDKTLPADAERLRRPHGVFLVARLNGQPAGCGALKGDEITRMWVDRAHRGLGLGARILQALEAEAVAMGRESVRLYTHRSLDEARAMYGAHGFVEVPRFNDDPYATNWLQKPLM